MLWWIYTNFSGLKDNKWFSLSFYTRPASEKDLSCIHGRALKDKLQQNFSLRFPQINMGAKYKDPDRDQSALNSKHKNHFHAQIFLIMLMTSVVLRRYLVKVPIPKSCMMAMIPRNTAEFPLLFFEEDSLQDICRCIFIKSNILLASLLRSNFSSL